jgi:hypothetical protein
MSTALDGALLYLLTDSSFLPSSYLTILVIVIIGLAYICAPQVLLYGPQGVGKTLVAKALAYEVSSLPTTTAAPPPATATISVRAGGTVHRNSSAAPPAAGPPPQRPAVVASGGGGLSYYVDVARLLAGQQSGSQADKVLQAVFKVRASRPPVLLYTIRWPSEARGSPPLFLAPSRPSTAAAAPRRSS